MGQPVIVVPLINDIMFKKNDIVFCKVGRHYYLHKISAVKNNNTYQISNNHGHIGTIGRKNIYGIVKKYYKDKLFLNRVIKIIFYNPLIN